MHASTYLSKILKNCGWECCPKDEAKSIEHIHPNSIKELESTTSPESEVECKQREAKEDIGYAVAELSKFSTTPAQCHHKAVKCIFCYLCQIKEWGLMYWRQEPHEELPAGEHMQQTLNISDLQFIGPKEGHQLRIYMYAAHATDFKCCRSIGGQAALFVGMAIAYLAKWQITVATSSTAAEFVQAVSVEKMVKYLCTILNKLGIT
eukprot:6667110-Ditylum_brightwellii.AAC.2